MTGRLEDIRRQALKAMRDSGVLMTDGHFDYGNGFHGRVYLNPHQFFRHPSTIWRFAQDLLDILPHTLTERTEIVAGPATGGALLAHTLAGLLDGRRSLHHPPTSFAPFSEDPAHGLTLRPFYAEVVKGRRVLLADDVRNTGKTFETCARLVREAGGTVLATVQICDRRAAVVDLDVPNYALVEYPASDNFPADDCPLCLEGRPVTRF